jgi:hypothetical protein
MIVFVTMSTARFMVAGGMAGVMMLLIAGLMPMWLVAVIGIGFRSFDMDMGNVIARMAVPQGGSGPRRGTRIEQ